MKYDRGHRSDDVVDRRGQGGGLGGGGIGLLFWIGSRFGLPGVLAALCLVGVVYFGSAYLGGGSDQGSDEEVSFVSFVLDDAQGAWTRLLAQRGVQYRHARLVLFTDSTMTACGYGESATGPFYCPGDEQIYIDLGFYRELDQRLGAPGDFAQAYVIAHEVGHHVQKILGLGGDHEQGAGGGSVRTELQADCFAGIWAHTTNERDLLEGGDIDEALRAAASIGDDRLQEEANGRVQPERWTHGSSAERARWFRIGLESGDIDRCDTFGAGRL